MTHRSLSTPNSGLRVFSASLLSALLIMMPFVQLAAAEKRSEVRSQSSQNGRQEAVSGQQDRATNAAAENVFLNAPVPKPAPEPLAAVIVATKDDGLAAAATVIPGGTITYTVNINNTSLVDAATNVQFSDTIDAHTTLVGDSAVAAVSDTYNTIGNTQISVPDGSTDLLGNDFDPPGNNAGMTVTAYGATTGTEQTSMGSATPTAQGGSVTVNANGSFTYDPPLGFEGTDTFKYRAADVNGFTAITTVTVTIAGMIWFINNNAGACTSSCDGRLSHPFQTLADFQAVNNGVGSNPAAGDSVFLYESATAYVGPVTLLNNQKFIGQDATATLASITGVAAPSGTDPFPVMNPGNGTIVNITATGANNAINLGQGNTLRGFTGGNTATGAKIVGNNFGTLIVGHSASPDVTLNGTGQALNLTTGTLSLSGGFVSVTTTSSAAQGINLAGVADSGVGAFSFGPTTVSNSTTQGINIGTTTADLNFGATTVSSTGSAINISMPVGATNTISFGATSATTTGAGVTAVNWVGAANTSMTFNSLSITRNNGTALNASIGGTINVTNGTGSITNTTPGGPAIIAANIALNANFSQINSSAGANGVSLTTVTGTSNFGGGQLTGAAPNATFQITGGTTTVTYSGNITQGAAAAMVTVTGGHGTGVVTFSGTLNATLGTGLQFNDADGTYNFTGTTTLAGGDAGIDILNGSGGTFSFGANTTITNPSGVAVNVDGSGAFDPVTGGITLPGSISKTSGGRLIDFSEYDTGTANISATLSCTSSCDGIEVTNNGGASGIVNFTSATKTLNTGGDTAVNLTDNDGGQINFTNGLDIDATSGGGFSATLGGTVTVTGGVNTIDTTTGTALTITGTTIGVGGLNFRSITSNGGTNGIVLNGTGASGGLTVAGNGGTCTTAASCTGGSIQNKTGDAISLTSTNSVSLTRMFVFTSGGSHIDATTVDGLAFTNMYFDTSTDHGILGSTVTTFTADDCMFDRGGFNQSSKHGIFMTNLLGTSSVTDSTFKRSGTIQFFVTNTTRSTAQPAAATDILTLSHNTWNDHTGAFGGDHFSLLAAGTGTASTSSNMRLVVNGTGGENKTGGLLAAGSNEGGNAYNVQATNTGKVSTSITAVDAMNVTSGVNIAASTGGTIIYDIFSNKTANGTGFQHHGIMAFNVACINSTCDGKFRDNSILHSAPANVNAVNIVQEGSGTNTIEITSNTISGSFQRAIHIQSRLGTGQTNATVTSNTMTATNVGGLQVFNAETGSSTVAPEDYSNKICLDLASNSATPAGTMDAYRLRNRGPSSASQKCTGCVFQLENFAGNGSNAGDVATWVTTTKSNAGLPINVSIDNAFSTSAGCATSTAMYQPEQSNQREYFASIISSETDATVTAAANTREVNTLAASQSSFLIPIANALTSSASETGARIAPTAIAHSAEVSSQRLDASEQRSEVRTHHAPSSKLETRNTTRGEETGLRAHYATLSKLATRSATAAPAPMLAETVTANIGTLPAGGSVTITFQVTVNNPPALTLLGPPRVENQGTVTADGGISVLTDDTEPTLLGAADKTATQIDLYGTTTSVITSGSPSNQGDPVTFTATVAPNNLPFAPPGGTNPTGTVQFLNGVTPLTCTEGGVNGIRPVSGGTAACTTSAIPGVGSPHTINANYSGDGNFDPSSGSVMQTVIPCVTNPVVDIVADEDDADCVSGDCSLREAIKTVCTGSTITFDTAGVFATAQTITLTVGELSVTRSSSLVAPTLAAQHVTVSGGNASRVFTVAAGKTFNINYLTITGGSAGSNGAVHTVGGTANLFKSTVSGNLGGGVFVDGTGVVGMAESTISGNSAAGDGAGVYCNNSSTLYITNSTVSGNTTPGSGGGIAAFNTCIVTIVNGTVTNNTADNDNNGSGVGGGIYNASGTVGLYNAIVAGNFNENGVTDANDDVNGALFASSSYNLIGDGTGMTGITHASNGNQVGTGVTPINALLGLLADNGGPTFTHALLTGSPAIDAGSNTNANNEALTTDQRGPGYPRILDSADADTTQTVDIGAFELHPSVENIGNQTTTEDTPKPVTFNLGDDTGSLITGGSVTATSSNATLVPNMPANLAFTGSGGSRTLTITPAANESGTTTITVTVTATNGRTATDTFDLTVTAANDNPALANNTGLTVNEASTGNIIDSAKLSVADIDNTPAQLTFTVGTAPANGTLRNNGVGLSSGGTFTQADIDGNLLTYDHNGSETTSDSFTFTVSDGAGGSIGSTAFNITVTAQNDAPTLGNNTGTSVSEGSTVNTITNAMLSVNDVDNTAAQITFTVGTAPANGTLRNNGVGLSSGGTFTQADINGNLLTYDHDGTNTTSDSFTFTVSDGAGGSIGSTAFNITVTAQNDAPVVTATGANLAYAEGDPATAVDTGLTVTDGDSANLTGATASITTNFQSGQDVLGWVENNAGDNITLSGTSTAQTIVLTGTDTPANYEAALRAVTYQNSSENPSTLTRTVTFTANDGASTGQATRNIDVSAANDNPTLTTNAGLTVLNSGTGTIDNTKLKVDDVDNTAAQLTFTVGTATTNGTLKKGVATLSAGGTFTQDDINNNLITYTHGGAGASDSFTFTVSDGAGGSIGNTTFNITIGDPDVRIHDAKVAEPASPNTVDMTFTVALSSPAAKAITVNFTTNNGSAVSGTCGLVSTGDYTATNGQVAFAIGDQVKTIDVPICSDAVADDGETFTITLNTPVNVNIVDGTATGTITANTPGTVLISELRTSGPGGAGDDFVEIYNNSNSPLTVAASDISAGYGLYKMGADCNAAPVLIGVIPNGTVIPARGHYLFVGSAYSLGNYGGPGAAAGNLTFSSDIETDANVGLFTTSDVTAISTANRLDAVGFGLNNQATCNLLREGSTLPAIAANATLEHSYFRKMCDWLQGQGCTVPGIPKDTNNNSDDFWLADTAGSAITGRLGAPGPENIASPIRRDNTGINFVVLDGTVGSGATPNRTRKGSDPDYPGSTFGTMTLRYRVTNNTGAPVTRLRYRIVDISTAIQPAGPTADLRALTGIDEDIAVGNDPPVGPVNDTVTCASQGSGTPCTITVLATTLEQPPNQAIGGGYNSTLSSDTVTITPLPNGQSILISFKLGVQKTGTFRFYIIVEALP